MKNKLSVLLISTFAVVGCGQNPSVPQPYMDIGKMVLKTTM